MKIINFDTESKYIDKFLMLSRKLYTKNDNMENPEDIRKLLLGTHPLNKYFKLYKFIILDNNDIVARFVITVYPDDSNGYIGLYECINDDNVSRFLFDEAYKFVKEKKLKSIVGPVDCSFWNKYRLKINLFDKRPYTGEPYNKDYYFKQFCDNGFKVIEHYTSNIYAVVSDDYSNAKFEEHFREFNEAGYSIISPKIDEYEKIIDELYYLLSDLYSDFPIYKSIELDDFRAIFYSYKSIINLNMIKLAYYKDKMVGFFISLPNYNNIVYHLNFFNILKILKLKKNPKEYVLLYMGVDKEHRGLGKALASSIVEELRNSKLPSIGALARDGKLTQNYADDLISTRYEYVLLERKIKK